MDKYIHVVVATGKWDQDNLRYRRHRFAEYLTKQPDTKEVVWVCPTPQKEKNKFRQLPNSVKEFAVSDLLPPRVFRFSRYFDIFYNGKIKSLLSYLEEKRDYKKVLWYTYPGFPGLANACQWEKVIYDCSDLWVAPVSGKNNLLIKLREESIRSSENRIIKNSDRIFCTSDFLGDTVKSNHYSNGKEVEVIENGVEYDLFNTLEITEDKRLNQIASPIIGYIGGIKPKLDFAIIRDIAVKHKEATILFIGPDATGENSDFKESLKIPNILWLGKVDPFDVPKYMNKIDIGILPYKKSIYNQAVFPLKLFEFLASGKIVLGMNLPSTQKYQLEDAYFYYDNQIDLIEKLDDLIESGSYRNSVELRKEYAKKKSWDSIFNTLYKSAMY
ncbi:glycosyltransferase [Metabacillus sp. HB246100]